MERYKCKIKEVIKENDETWTYVLENPKEHDWTIGANTHVALEGYDIDPLKVDKSLVHHMSITSFPHDGNITFSTRGLEKILLYLKES